MGHETPAPRAWDPGAHSLPYANPLDTPRIQRMKTSTPDQPSTAGEAAMPQAGGCAGSEPFALQVLGDSMTPEFDDGAIIIVEADGVIETGCYVVAEHDAGGNKQEYLLRQLRIDGDRWYLDALNARYPSIEIAGRAAIKGRVVQRAGRRRRDRKSYI